MAKHCQISLKSLQSIQYLKGLTAKCSFSQSIPKKYQDMSDFFHFKIFGSNELFCHILFKHNAFDDLANITLCWSENFQHFPSLWNMWEHVYAAGNKYGSTINTG